MNKEEKKGLSLRGNEEEVVLIIIFKVYDIRLGWNLLLNLRYDIENLSLTIIGSFFLLFLDW